MKYTNNEGHEEKGMEKAIYQSWLKRVTYDIDTAEAMYATKRYIYAVFSKEKVQWLILKMRP